MGRSLSIGTWVVNKKSMQFSNLQRWLITILFIALSNTCLASIQLYVLQPSPQHQKFIIVAQDGESPEAALSRYKTQLMRSSLLKSLVSAEQLQQFSPGHLEKLEVSEKPAVLILANRGYDLTNEEKVGGQQRVEKFQEKLGLQSDVFLLPIAGSIGLSNANRKLYYDAVIEHFSAVIALGGPDVTPKIYSEAQTEARDVNLIRDQYEIDFLKHWIKAKKGFLFGVCRGHQMIAAALGFKLTQHIEDHGDGVWTEHPIKLLPTKSKFLRSAVGMSEFMVNSYHHQAVVYQSHPDVDLAAIAPDNTVEALESRDGRIVSTQFHVEFMDDIVSERIFARIITKIKNLNSRFGVGRCASLF
ncbi:hypothetical protein CIK05_06440 [Bdellovibrio sp. qaytius]|nr:hypothetical protein CIK05_06440 [Bdellovibrio sp. qaytius]